jgi:hypothetical protein
MFSGGNKKLHSEQKKQTGKVLPNMTTKILICDFSYILSSILIYEQIFVKL